MSSTQTLRTEPYTIQQGSGSTLPWDIDMTAHLGVGESVSAPAAALEDLRTGAAYAGGVLSAVAQSSTTVRVTLQALVRGARYRLVVRFTAAAGKTPATETLVEVPF
jgi:hypothetical protein